VMAFQLGLYLGSMDPSWAVPESCTPAGLFNNTLDEDMFSGLDFAPETYTYTPPHGSTSPATSLYDMDALYLSSNHYAPVDPLTPISLSSGTPESALSPASPAAIFSQTFPYHECSHHNNPNPPAASPSAGSTTTTTTTTTPNPNDTNPPNKPSRKPPHDKNKHLRFRCPVTPATTARCAKGFLDARTLHRHIWTHHKAYARAYLKIRDPVRSPLVKQVRAELVLRSVTTGESSATQLNTHRNSHIQWLSGYKQSDVDEPLTKIKLNPNQNG
jgi:hypothetical protein